MRHIKWIALHSHSHSKESRTKLLIACGLCAIFFVIELSAGFFGKSMTLMGDAFHMWTDFLSLSVSVILLRTGVKRYERMGAIFNAALLVFVIVGMTNQVLWPSMNPSEMKSGLILSVAILGLVINLIMLKLTHSKDHLLLQSAFIHVLSDTLTSVCAIVSGLAAFFFHWNFLDRWLSIGVILILIYVVYGFIKKMDVTGLARKF